MYSKLRYGDNVEKYDNVEKFSASLLNRKQDFLNLDSVCNKEDNVFTDV